MDTVNRQLHLDDLLSQTPYAGALTHLDQQKDALALPSASRDALIQALRRDEPVLLAERRSADSALAVIPLPRKAMGALPALYARQQQLSQRYGCRGLCVAEGRLTTDRYSAPLLLHPVELIQRGERWLIQRSGALTLFNPKAFDLLPPNCPVPQEGWSDEGTVLAHQLDTAIAQTPGCILDEGLWLSVFPLWAIELIETAHQPLPSRSLATQLENGTLPTETEVPDCSKTDGEEELLAPFPLDGTQMTALRLLTQGEHVLVSGRRGTGKTQLAVGLAINAMGSRQRTLIVAPKMSDRLSALERMKELGLERLCLHIPSGTERTENLLYQYSAASQLAPVETTGDFFSLAQTHTKVSRQLDRHLTALHAPSRCGLSPWELLCRYLELQDVPGCLSIPEMTVSRLDREGLEQALSAAQELTRTAKSLGNVTNHPLSLITGTEYPGEEAAEIPHVASDLHTSMKELEEAAALWCGLSGQSFPVTQADWTQLITAAQRLGQWQDYPQGWRTSPRIGLLPDTIHEFHAHFDEAEALQNRIRQDWEEEVFGLDACLLEKQWRQLQDKWTLPTDPEREETLLELLEQANTLLQTLELAGKRWSAAIHASLPDTRDNWERYYEIALELARWKEIPREWGSCSSLSALLWDVGELIRHGKQAKESKEVLLRSWKPEFLRLDGRKLMEQWEKEGGNWGIGWLRRQSPLRSEVEEYCKVKLTADELENGLRWLMDFQDELAYCDEIYHRWEPELQSVYKREDTVWVWLENARVVAAESHDWLAELTGSSDFLRQFGSSAEAVAAAQELQIQWEQTRDVLGRLDVIIGRTNQPDSPGWLKQRQNDCRRLQSLLNIRRQLADLAKHDFALGDIAPALRRLARHQKQRTAIAALYERWEPELKDVYQGADTDWDELYLLSLQALRCDNELSDLTGDLDLRHRLADREDVQDCARQLCTLWQTFQTELNEFTRLTTARLGRGTGSWLNLLRGNIALILEHLPQLEDWMNWNRLQGVCKELGLEVFSEHFSQPIAEGEDIIALFRKSLYRSLLLRELDWAPELRNFSARQMSALLRKFTDADETYNRRIQEELYHVSTAHIPELAEQQEYQEEFSALLRANQTDGRRLSPEELVQSLPKLTKALFPCVLASPSDALGCFPRSAGDKPVFDYIVIDGADALPATVGQQLLALGKVSLLISHDRGVDYPVCTGEESIWSRCADAHLPRLALERSYLLRQESLHWLDLQLYGLKSYPSCQPTAFAIRYKTVVGQMEHHTNPAEAAAISALALTLAKEGALAVAAVTEEQSSLIRSHLRTSVSEDPSLEPLLSQITVCTTEELGSRRWDRVILSLTLAADRKQSLSAARKLAQSWQELEPMVDTLAAVRQELILFSSLDVSDWEKLGSKQLTAFLHYAQAQTMPVKEAPPFRHRIQQEVCAFLERSGYRALPCEAPLCVRVSSPKEPERWLLGILMDDDSYGALPRTRERELDQIALLQQQGWNLCRLWSLDWLQNQERVTGQLLRLLTVIQEQGDLFSASETAEEAPAAPSLYTPAHALALDIRDNELAAPAFRDRVILLAEQVLRQEAPLPTDRLTERVLTAFELDPQDEGLQLQCNVIWYRLGLTMTEEEGQSFIWAPETPPEQYTLFRISGNGEHYRPPKEVSAQESANAAAQILKERFTLTPSRLAWETARLLGYDPEDEDALDCGRRGVTHGCETGRFRTTAVGTVVL